MERKGKDDTRDPFVKLSVVGVRAMARNTHRAGVRESTVGLYSARQESADAIQRIRERLSAGRAAEPPALEQLTVEASGLYHMLEGMLDRGEVLAQSHAITRMHSPLNSLTA